MSRRVVITISVVVAFISLLWLSFYYLHNTPKVTKEPVVITDSFYNYANYCQSDAYVYMGEENGQLYFNILRYYSSIMSNKIKLLDYFSVFENGTIRKIKKIENSIWDTPIANGQIYYWKHSSGHYDVDGTYDLVSYDIDTEEERTITSMREVIINRFIDSSGTIRFSSGGDEYYAIPPDLSVISAERPGFQAGEYTYSLSYRNKSDPVIIRTDRAGNEEIIELEYGHETLIPCDYGVLVHNQGQEHLLYLIDNEGCIQELFYVPCMYSGSTINVYGDYAYISFRRYEKYGKLGLAGVSFENDTLQGTWRISLSTGESEKISDNIYNGIYIFDNTGMYVCDDESNIYKLNFEGEIIQVLLEHRF